MEIVVSGQLPTPSVALNQSAVNARTITLAKAQQVLAITEVSDLDLAASALTDVKALIRTIEASHKEVKAPVLAMTRQIDGIKKDYLAPLEVEASRLSAMVGSYQEAARKKAEKLREAEAAAQAAALEEMEAKQAAAVAAGDEEAADAARAEAADKIAASQLAVIAAEGPKADGITTRSSHKFEVVDIDALFAARPDLCVIEPNNAAIRAIIKATNGKPIAGLRIWKEAAAIVRNAAPVNVESFDY